MRYFLAFDAGTTAMKVTLLDETGGTVAAFGREYSLTCASPMTAELAAETYWDSARAGTRDVLVRGGVHARDVAALVISSQGETLIAMGADGTPLRPAIVWMDNRSVAEAGAIENHFGAVEVQACTGQPQVVPTWPATKILWLKRHEPDVFRQTAKFCMVEDYLLHKLTGQWVGERSVHSSSLWLDIRTGALWDDMLAFLGVTADRFPDIRGSGEVLGTLRPEAARELGLGADTAVVTGALDQPAGAIGAGNIRPGMCSETTGAALAAVITLDRLALDPKRCLPCHIHGLPGLHYFLMPWGQTAGMVLKWFRDTFCREGAPGAGVAHSYAELAAEAAAVPPGCDGLTMLPHLAGAASPEFDPWAKGVFFGFGLQHGRGHFVRAIMEAVACMLRRNLDLLPAMGLEVAEIRSMGGGAQSALWNRIKADMTRKPVQTTRGSETACLGVAMLAACALGIYPDLAAAAAAMVRLKDRYEPEDAHRDAYENQYRAYLRLYDALQGVFQAAAGE